MLEEQAKKIIINKLQQNIQLYSSNEIFGFDQGFDDFLVAYPKENEQLRIAVEFWEAWSDEAGHGYPGFYEPIKKNDWVRLAEEIITKLNNNEAIENPLVKDIFLPGKVKFHPGRFLISATIMFLLLAIFFPLAPPIVLIVASISIASLFQWLNVRAYSCKRKK